MDLPLPFPSKPFTLLLRLSLISFQILYLLIPSHSFTRVFKSVILPMTGSRQSKCLSLCCLLLGFLIASTRSPAMLVVIPVPTYHGSCMYFNSRSEETRPSTSPLVIPVGIWGQCELLHSGRQRPGDFWHLIKS